MLTHLHGLPVTAHQLSAIRELESRGLIFCAHFGVENAVEIMAEMDAAFLDGRLYEWLRSRLGVTC